LRVWEMPKGHSSGKLSDISERLFVGFVHIETLRIRPTQLM
jgi:hypothetical protein